jgi:hypothetical protein
MLFLPVLDNELVSREVAVHWQWVSPAALPWVAEESGKAVLPSVVGLS